MDTANPIRILAKPVSETRDQITITVTDAVSNGDKTLIVIKMERIPADRIPQSELAATCALATDMRLLDGSLLGYVDGGGSQHWTSGYETR